ncbi:MAG: tryptophan--tRNA ligase, partial [Ginsengibacter sp.]
TDSGPTEKKSTKPSYIENLFTLMKLVSSNAVVAQYEEAFNNCNIRYGAMKKQLAEDMVGFIAPIRNKANKILNDEKYLAEVMQAGSKKAITSAETTMKLVRNAMGLNYY